MECTGEQKHESKICPRCENSFICKVGDVANCQCSAVKMSIEDQNYLAEKYGDCLCCTCMKEEQHNYALNKFYNKMKLMLRMDRYKFNEEK